MSSTNEGRYSLDVDTERNRLYMAFEGMIDAETARSIVRELETDHVPQLDPGFDLVNDITDFSPASQEAARAIEEGKEIMAEAGCEAVARVMGDSVIGKMQFENHGDDAYHTVTAESREQAEEFLVRFREGER